MLKKKLISRGRIHAANGNSGYTIPGLGWHVVRGMEIVAYSEPPVGTAETVEAGKLIWLRYFDLVGWSAFCAQLRGKFAIFLWQDTVSGILHKNVGIAKCIAVKMPVTKVLIIDWNTNNTWCIHSMYVLKNIVLNARWQVLWEFAIATSQICKW